MTTLPDYDAALGRALEAVRDVTLATETVDFMDADGRVLATPIRADRDLPPFRRAQMDGYALRAADLARGGAYPVVARVAAGQSVEKVRVPSGACVAIATGAPLPDDVDTVIPHERSDRNDPVHFDLEMIEPGAAVHSRGADAARGAVIVPAGTRLEPQHLGLAATVGATTLEVRRRPRGIVLTSGDEVVAPDRPVLAHQIRNSNGPQALALLGRLGAAPVAQRHVEDEAGPTRAAVGAALAEADVVVTIGGISAGERDHFPEAFAHHGVELFVHGAAIQPGKPVIVGRAHTGAIVVGLPGNPVSALACGCLFVGPIVRALLGREPGPAWLRVRLGAPVRPNPRRQAFRPARIETDGTLTVPAWAGSGDLAHTAATDGLVALPVQPEPVPAGAELPFLPWPRSGA